MLFFSPCFAESKTEELLEVQILVRNHQSDEKKLSVSGNVAI